MNPLLAVLIRGSVEYTYGLIDRFYKEQGRMPTKSELLDKVDSNIEALTSVSK